jgi:hypothetical protein
MTTCQSCNTENTDDAKFCKNCGAGLPTQEIQTPVSEQQAAPSQPAPVQQYQPPGQAYAPRPPKDKSIALILEILPGLFGLLGIGWIYSGNTTTGVLWLIGFLVWTIVATVISVATVGIGIICWLPISIGLIAISAISLNNYTKAHPELFG